MAMQQNTIAFTQMLGSAQKAQAFLSQMQAFAATTPFQFSDLLDASKRMLAFGFSAQQVIPDLKAVGDAASALGTGTEGVDSIIDALGKMQNAGKVDSREMMELVDAGIPAWKILASSMGLSVAQVQNLSAQGKLLSSQVLPLLLSGLEKTYGGQMAAQMNTTAGIISNIKDKFQMFLVAVGSPILKALQGDLTNVANVMQSPAFANFANLLSSGIVTMLNDLGALLSSLVNPSIQAFGGHLNTASGFLNAAKGAVSDINGKIQQLTQIAQQLQLGQKFAEIAGIVLTVRQAISDFIASAMPAFKNLAGAISGLLPVAQGIASWLAGLASNGPLVQGVLYAIVGAFLAWKAIQMGQWIAGTVKGITDFIGDAQKMASTIGNAANAALQFAAKLPEMIAGLAEMIPVLASNVAGWIADTAASIAAAIAENAALWPITLIVLAIAALVAIIILLATHWQQVTAFLQSTWQRFSSWFGGVMSGLGTVVHNFVTGVQHFFAPLVTFLHKIFDPWIVFFTQLFTVIGEIILAAVTKFAQIAGDGFLLMFQGIQTALNDAKAFIGSVFSAIGTIAHGAWNLIYHYIVQPNVDAWKELVSIWNTIQSAISTALNAVWSVVTNVWNKIISTISSRMTDLKNALMGPFTAARDLIGNVIRALVDNIINMLNDGIRGAADFVNHFADAINWIAEKLGVSARISHIQPALIPTYATGTNYHPGGPAIVGEEGPELVYLSQGAMVLPHAQTMQLLHAGIPGYAGGLNVGDIWSLISGGAAGLIKAALDALGGKVQLPGFLSSFASTLLTTLENDAKSFVQGLINTFTSLFGGNGGASGTPGNFPGNLTSWITDAIQDTGVPMTWLVPLETIAMHESGGNPNAVNNWDINAKEGHPSEGLMQTIGPTFAAYELAGHTNIFNPTDNTIAAIRYIEARYGSVFNVPGIVSLAKGGPYVGYANGGMINEQIFGIGLSTGQKYAFGEKGPEIVAPASTNASSIFANASLEVELNVDGHKFAKTTINNLGSYLKLKHGK